MKNKLKNETRRARKKRQKLTDDLVVTGTNANGLRTKRESFLYLLANDSPQVVMVQETKAKRKNQLKAQGYELFEKVRTGKDGGGIMIGVRKDIDSTPVIVSNDDEDVEILTVEIIFKSIAIRFLTGYGPQEDSSEDKINKFYATLEEEIISCEQENCGLIAELDCNAKLGREIIKGDPKK